jgi:ACS family hexuronate transporter-like MFS transporter
MNLKQIAYFAWIPFLAADLGSFVGGMLSPMFQKMGLKVITARKASMTAAACMMPFALFIAKAPSGEWAILWFCCAAFGHNCISATLLTLPADLFPMRTVATANGLSGCIGGLGGFIFTLTVGWLVMHIGYTPIFSIIAVLDLVGAGLLWSLVRAPQSQAAVPAEVSEKLATEKAGS